LIAYCLKKLFCGATPAAETKDLDQWLRQIKAAGRLPRELLVVDEVTFNILHSLAAGANQVVMRFEIAFHQQSGSMGTYFPEQSVLHE
jgi:hypothetical protein